MTPLGRALPAGRGKDPAHLLSPGVQCPVLSSSVQERHGACLAEGNEGDLETSSLVRKGWESWACSASRRDV